MIVIGSVLTKMIVIELNHDKNVMMTLIEPVGEANPR